MNLSPKQRVERAHATIVRTPELAMFSSLVMMGDTTISADCDTARTDGINIEYGADFINTLSDAELVFVAMHEALHIGFRHLITWDKLYREDALLANSACDYVINLVLYDLSKQTPKLAMPKDDTGEFMGLLDEKYRGMSAGEVYKLLKEEDKQQQQQQQQQQSGAGTGTPLRQQLGKQQFDEHDFDSAADMSDGEKEELRDNVDRALRQGMTAANKMGASAPRAIKDLLAVELDWREVLADFVCSAVQRTPELATWRKINRRMAGMAEHDVYMPSYYDDRISKVVLAIDTSGSVFHLTETFISHVIKVCSDVQPEELHIMYWDTSVAKHEVYKPDQYAMLAKTTRAAGGGGTDVRCVPDYMRKHSLIDADAVIVLTDGEFFYGQGDWGSIPLLWAVIKPYDTRFVPEVGAKVSIKI